MGSIRIAAVAFAFGLTLTFARPLPARTPPAPEAGEHADMAWFVGECREPGMGRGFCIGYISGMVAMHAIEGVMFDGPALLCFTGPTNVEAMRRAVLLWADKYPAYLSRPMQQGVLAALHEAYSCEAPNSKKFSRFGNPVR